MKMCNMKFSTSQEKGLVTKIMDENMLVEQVEEFDEELYRLMSETRKNKKIAEMMSVKSSSSTLYMFYDVCGMLVVIVIYIWITFD